MAGLLNLGHDGAVTDHRLRLMDLLAALSVSTDLGMGQPPETALRSSLLASKLARAMDLPEGDVRNACLGTLLRHVGCTATAAAEARLFGGDELVSRQAAQPADFGNPREMLLLTLSTGRGEDSGAPRRSPRCWWAVPGTAMRSSPLIVMRRR